MFIVYPNLFILCWDCVKFTGCVVICVGRSDLCCIKLMAAYNYMGQSKPNPFINHVKIGQPTLTQNMFIVNPNPLISCRDSRVMSNIATPTHKWGIWGYNQQSSIRMWRACRTTKAFWATLILFGICMSFYILCIKNDMHVNKYLFHINNILKK